MTGSSNHQSVSSRQHLLFLSTGDCLLSRDEGSFKKKVTCPASHGVSGCGGCRPEQSTAAQGLRQRVPISRDWKPRVGARAGSVSGEDALSCVWLPSPRVLTWPLLVCLPPLLRPLVTLEMGPSSGPQLASLTSEGHLQGRSPWELELQHLDLGGTEFSP